MFTNKQINIHLNKIAFPNAELVLNFSNFRNSYDILNEYIKFDYQNTVDFI